jgi:hypothetical protein
LLAPDQKSLLPALPPPPAPPPLLGPGDARLERIRQLPAEDALAVAQSIGVAYYRDAALAELAARLPAQDALRAADSMAPGYGRDKVLMETARRLPGEDALPVARAITFPFIRPGALLEVAQRLPPEERASALADALAAARAMGAEWTSHRAAVLAEVARQLPAVEQSPVIAEAFAAAQSIVDAGQRAGALAAVAERLGGAPATDLWFEPWMGVVRTLAMRSRGECVTEFAALAPFIAAIGGNAAISGLAGSIVSVGRWWS